jgi:hypothetical protein
LYVVETSGRIGVVRAGNIKSARRWAYDEVGRNNVTVVRVATPKDVEWFLSMGGGIHNA